MGYPKKIIGVAGENIIAGDILVRCQEGSRLLRKITKRELKEAISVAADFDEREFLNNYFTQTT